MIEPMEVQRNKYTEIFNVFFLPRNLYGKVSIDPSHFFMSCVLSFCLSILFVLPKYKLFSKMDLFIYIYYKH